MGCVGERARDQRTTRPLSDRLSDPPLPHDLALSRSRSKTYSLQYRTLGLAVGTLRESECTSRGRVFVPVLGRE